MMKTRICTKCGGRDLKLGKRRNYAVIAISWIRGVATNAVICRACGYVEEYVIPKHMKYLNK